MSRFIRRASGLVLGASVFVFLPGCPGFELLAPEALRDVLAEGSRLGSDRTSQDGIAAGQYSLLELRQRGMAMFTTPFNAADGYGDGPMDPNDPITPGGRPTLQNNGVFLRVNGLDAQTCLECHSILSNASVPPVFGIAGVGAVSSNALIKPVRIDTTDEADAGFATLVGRFANPPFLFGSGGIELLAKEMTQDLQRLRQQAVDNPDTDVALVTKGVSFGTIRYAGGALDTSRVEGIDDDLVVRPFGRKGEFATVRQFDIEAVQFHFGMQPVELFGEGVDEDGDGVVDEVLPGELSALHIFNTTLKPPLAQMRGEAAERGAALFGSVGCTACHVPALTTQRRRLTFSFPEILTDPFANVFYDVDLAEVGFEPIDGGGVVVPAFSDLKRHDMGDRLAESSGGRLDRLFITARLWGVADTAPYLHDGRAMTLRDAIMYHGGEAQTARDSFAALSAAEQDDLIEFLRSLRTPLDATDELE